MKRLRVRASSLSIVLSSVAVLACGDDGTDATIPATVRVTPEAATFSSIGDSQQLSAAVLDEAGSTINTSVTWSEAVPTVVEGS